MMDMPSLGFVYHGFAFLSMFLVSWWAYKTKSLKFFSENGWAQNSVIQLFLLIWGIMVWAIIPITTLDQPNPLVVSSDGNGPRSVLFIIVILLSITSFFVGRSQSKKLDTNSHQLKPNPSGIVILSYSVFRLLFLISYEIWFRGYFLNDLISVFPTPVAIGINVFLYALIHIFGGTKEALGSIGFGIILCLLVVALGNVWPAIFIHLSLSIGYEASFFARKLGNRLK